MKIKFLGATHHVTGSCSWLNYTKTGAQFLVDCGMHQGGNVEYLNQYAFPFKPSELSFVLLTHAHLDHCGLIPRLYKEGFTGKVITTSATAKLAQIIMEDSAKIGSLYDLKDVASVKFHCIDDGHGFTWGRSFPVSTGIKVCFLRSSHILGAASISIAWSEVPENFKSDTSKTICFSGDIGCNTEDNSYLPLMKANKHPFSKTDYLIVESTYGGTIRPEHYQSSSNRQFELDNILKDTIYSKRGKVLIPSFSIHRAQEIMADLLSWIENLKEERKVNVLVQSPMIAKSCQVYYEEIDRKIITRKGSTYQYLSNRLEESITKGCSEGLLKKLFNTRQGNKHLFSKIEINGHSITVSARKIKDPESYDVIIASSGMCNAGPICGYLDMYSSDTSNSIILTGYQAKGNLGHELKEIADNGSRQNHAEVFDLSPFYSGHADQKTLLDYIFNLNGFNHQTIDTTVFINHGEPQSKQDFKDAIQDHAELSENTERQIQKVLLAEKNNDWFNLEIGEYEMDGTKNENDFFMLSNKVNNLESLMDKQQRSLDQLVSMLASRNTVSDQALNNN